MADPISFDPFLGWVDITDPNNIPEEARVIGAGDLLRYEQFGVNAAAKINEIAAELDAFDADAALAGTIAVPASATRAAVQGMVDDGVVDFQAVIDDVPGAVAAQVPPLVADAIAADGTVAAAAAAGVGDAIAAADLVVGTDARLPKSTDDDGFRVRDSNRRVAFEVNGAGETVIGATTTREASPYYPTALRIMDSENNIAFEVTEAGEVFGSPDTTIRTQLVEDEGASSLTKVGVVLGPGAPGTFDAGMVESPCIGIDPVPGRQAMLYTGYSATDGTAVASHGIAYSDDGVTWTRAGQYFTASGVPGSPDENGVTGPNRLFHEGYEHLFYIGLTEVGYEAGDKTLCHASRPIGGEWTRHGAIIAPAGNGWYATHIWHPNFVYFRGWWYCFFNASGNPGGKERMGFAKSRSLYGPWEVNPEPLMADPEGDFPIISGDGFVWLEDGMVRMDYFRATAGYASGYEVWATTTVEEFPFGWVERGISLAPTAGTYDAKFAHKPWITRREGRIYHYHTAVSAGNVRAIALAVTGGPLEVRKPAAPLTIPPGSTDAQKLTIITNYLISQNVLVQG